MSQIFTPEHFKTAEQFGYHHLSDVYGETAYELALTLPLLEGQGDIGVPLAELQGYHFLQYGKDSEVVAEAIEYVRADIDSDRRNWKASEILDGRLERILETDELTKPLELGRIALSKNTHVDPRLQKVTEKVEIKDYGGVQCSGDFLYPGDGVSMFYRGRGALDVKATVQASMSTRVPLPAFIVHVDSIGVEDKDGDRQFFAALSYENRGHSTLTSIQKV